MTKRFDPPVFQVRHDLIEAFMGYYELDRDAAILRIIQTDPHHRLDVYLRWNGVIDYTDRAYDIALGKVT